MRSRSLSGYSQRVFYSTLRMILPENRFGDRLYAFLRFVHRHKRRPTQAPVFNDMLYQLKASGEISDPLRVFVSDKEFVKLFVKAVVGDEFNVPTLAVLRSPGEVDRYDFPPDCCIKPTQASGRVILRRNNEPVDRDCIKGWFALNYYRLHREANYKTLQPKVIVEPLLFNDTNLMDYKFFCYRGRPRMIQVDVDRYIDHRRRYFDSAWNELDFSIIYPRADKKVEKPANLERMLEVASKLSEAFSFVRVDIYSDGQSCLVGEITHCAEGAGGRFIPLESEQRISKLVFQ
jgi:hypothetical protein